MFRRVLSHLKQLMIAVVVLVLVLCAAELYLHERSAPSSTVSPQVVPGFQHMLVASDVTHHGLRRLYRPDDAGIEAGIAASFQTNSLGLRGAEIELRKPSTVFRVLLLGDETVLGIGIDDDFTLDSLLQKFLTPYTPGQQVEVINAGIPGFCPLLSQLQYTHQLAQLDPDLVILHVDMSDVADDSYYRRHLRLSGSSAICPNGYLVQPGAKSTGVMALLENSALIGFLRGELVNGLTSDGVEFSRDMYAWTRSAPPDLRLDIRHTLDPLIQLQREAVQNGHQLAICASPVFWQVIQPTRRSAVAAQFGITDEQPVTRDLPFQILQAFAEQSGLTFCSAVDNFREFESPDRLFADDSMNLSKYGTALYAREIARTILSAPKITQSTGLTFPPVH